MNKNTPNKDAMAEMKSVFGELNEIDRYEVVRFGLARIAHNKSEKIPCFTPQEWARLTRWQQNLVCWRVRWYMFRNTLRIRIGA